jgi:purine-binding chemotaxis protein CheW
VTGPGDGLAARVAQLRTAFDRSFAEPVAGVGPRMEHLLTIRVGGRPYAIRLSEVAGVFTGWSVVPVPGPRPELLGVAGHRGDLVPVYDLGALLGSAEPSEPVGARRPGCVVLATGSAPVAFAFDRTDGHVRIPADALPPPGRDSGTWAMVHAAGASWTVVVLARLIAAIEPDHTAAVSAPHPTTGSEQP